MTLETRLLIEIKDLLGVRYVCKCGASVTRTPAGADRIPAACGQCNLPWYHGDEDSAVIHFARALAALRLGTDANYHLVLEAGSPLKPPSVP